MTDHLAAGCSRDAEIAIQEEVAQAASGEFGITWFDVGKFVDDSVLIHRGLHCSCSCNRGNAQASNFLAAQDAAFTASWCYAKITPATLHSGDFDNCRGGGAEAAGRRRKFELRDSRRAIAGPMAPIA
jgi:hypothetical protein